MNFFQTIKGTFFNVQKDISNSFKSLKKPDQKNKSDGHVHHLDGEVNPEAGADLLHRYEESWAQIHHSIEESSRVAKKIDLDVCEVCVHCERQTDALKEFILSLSSLPDLTKQIGEVLETMDSLEEDFARIESMLLNLEDVCEQKKLAENKQKHFIQLKVYKHQKDLEVEKAKVKLAKVHSQKVQAHEARLQECLREKQRAIEDTHHYEDEIMNYKLSGQISLKSNLSVSSSDADLADIYVEDDHSALEEFLEDIKVQNSAGELKITNNNDQQTVKEIQQEGSEENCTKDTVEDFVNVTADRDIDEEDLQLSATADVATNNTAK